MTKKPQPTYEKVWKHYGVTLSEDLSDTVTWVGTLSSTLLKQVEVRIGDKRSTDPVEVHESLDRKKVLYEPTTRLSHRI